MVELETAVEALRRATPLRPRVMLVLGSGLGTVTDHLSEVESVPLSRIPGIPPASVEGHRGKLVAGRLGGTAVWVQSGRLHLYEGHAPELVSAPVRIAAELGVDMAIVTNAAGGIRPDLEAGSLVLLDDVLNLTFRDPLRRRSPSERGSAISEPGAETFDPDLGAIARRVARARGVRLFRGTYAGVLGPSFETPAEIRMIRRLGGHLVGMSTVPEVLALRGKGVRVLGLSLVTNRAAGLRKGPLSHREVVARARSRAPALADLVQAMIRELGEDRERGGVADRPR